MNLRNIHNETTIAIYEKGKLVAHGMDGHISIFVKEARQTHQKLKPVSRDQSPQGEIDCQISRVRTSSRIHIEEGDVHLRVTDTHPLKISIEANDIIPDAHFKKLGEFGERKTGGGAPTKDGQKLFTVALHPEK